MALARALAAIAGRAARRSASRQFGGASGEGPPVHATTVLCVRKDGEVTMGADGQVTMGTQVIKPNTRKVRRITGGALAGFAGATADGMALLERLEQRLEEKPGQLLRAAVDLAKAWRTEKFLQKLDAMLVVADKEVSLQITGQGDVLEPEDGIIAVGSGGPFAVGAAKALSGVDGLSSHDVCTRSLKIAADSCIYTNHNIRVESIDSDGAYHSSPLLSSSSS